MAKGRFGAWAQARGARLQEELCALLLCYRCPQTPWYARLLPLLVLAYAVSPIDLIPDVVPVLGLLDDLFLLPLGVWLCVRLIPRNVWNDCRRQAAEMGGLQGLDPRFRRVGTACILLLWLLLAVFLLLWLL